MWLVYVIFQGFALLGLLMWWPMWTGRSTGWVEGRRRGWPALLFLGLFLFSQACVLGLLAMDEPGYPRPIGSEMVRSLLMGLGFFSMVGGLLAAFVGTQLWWPRFLLPGWVRERLAAGDPVRTAEPLPEVQHLMTRRQNQPVQLEPSALMLDVPTVVRVRRVRWWVGAVLVAVALPWLTGALVGVPASVFDTTGPFTESSRPVLLFLVPLAAYLLMFYGRAALFPEDLEVTAQGVSARSWSVSWDEIEEVVVTGPRTSHKGVVFLRVNESAWHREKAGNRWTSGSPLGLGGLLPAKGVLRVQPGTEVPPGQLGWLLQDVGRVPGNAMPTEQDAHEDLHDATDHSQDS